MRKNKVIEQDRCYHLISRLAHRAFFLDDEEKDRAVALMRRVEAGVKASMSYCINRTLSISSDPFDPFNEVMTGFEYVAAAEMIFQGMDADAVKVVKAVRDRHDGLKRNPYSEPECGHNYARSMASWNCLLAWLKMHGGDARNVIWR